MDGFRRWWAWLRSSWDQVRTSFWLLPTLLAAAAALAASLLVELDRSHAVGWLTGAWPLRLAEATPDGARAILSVIAGSMITVTGVVFSITVVALTLAASQFGPRLLRNFMADQGTQLVLGTFLATFLFSLLVLRSVQGGETSPFVPELSLGVAILLSITSLFVLIYYIHHAASSMQAASVICSVSREIEQQMDALFPERTGREAAQAESELEAWARDIRARGIPVESAHTGYVRVWNGEAVLSAAMEHGFSVVVEKRPGDFVSRHAVLAYVRGEHGPATEADLEATHDAFVIGAQRTALQDFRFLFDQLSEMAVRALSPGTNDPRTAVACVRHLGAALVALGRRSMPSAARTDAGGDLRVLAPPTRFDELARCAFDPIRRYGCGDAEVAVALLEAIGEAADHNPMPERRAALEALAEDVRRTAEARLESKRDRAQVEDAHRKPSLR